MQLLKNLFKFIFVSYGIFCLGLWLMQDQLIFNPTELSEDYRFRSGEEVEVEVEKGVFLNCLWMREGDSKGVILYLHGNRGSNSRCWHQAQNMVNNEYDIFMPDYRGFGKSDGTISSEKQLLADVQIVYDFLKQHYKENKIIITGYSLGSGMASWLASNNRPQQLVMIAPYFSFYDLKDHYIPIYIPDLFVRYPLDSGTHLKGVECPITLFHGTRDRVIPYDSSEKLRAVNPSGIELVTLKNEGHRGAIFNGSFRRKFSELLR